MVRLRMGKIKKRWRLPSALWLCLRLTEVKSSFRTSSFIIRMTLLPSPRPSCTSPSRVFITGRVLFRLGRSTASPMASLRPKNTEQSRWSTEMLNGSTPRSATSTEKRITPTITPPGRFGSPRPHQFDHISTHVDKLFKPIAPVAPQFSHCEKKVQSTTISFNDEASAQAFMSALSSSLRTALLPPRPPHHHEGALPLQIHKVEQRRRRGAALASGKHH